MTALNYERLALRDKQRVAVKFEMEKEKWEWSSIRFGKYSGLTMPEMALLDPSYFYWSVSERKFRGRQEREQGFILARLGHLRPPDSEFADPVFRITLGPDKSLEGISIARARRKCGERVFRTYHLNVCAVLESMSRNHRYDAGKLISDFIREVYFEGRPYRRYSCEEFFTNDEWFDLTCREDHKIDS